MGSKERRKEAEFPPPEPGHGTQAQMSADRQSLTEVDSADQNPISSTKRIRWVKAGDPGSGGEESIRCRIIRDDDSDVEVHILYDRREGL